MVQYLVVFFGLMFAAVGLYMIYDRYLRRDHRGDSSLYVEALRDLLDGRAETAFTKLRQVVADDSENIDAYLRLAQILRDHNRPDRALQVHKDLTLRKGLSKEQKAAVLRQLAADYVAVNELETAQAALKELTSLVPDDRRAYAELLKTQKQLQQWDDAYDTAAQILKLEANKSKKPLAVFRYQMGLQLKKTGEHRKARVLFKESLGLDPQFAPAYLAIGDSYHAEQRFEDAVNFWNKLIKAVPDQGSRVLDRLNKALFDLGRYGDIAGACERILAHSPKDSKVLMTLGEFYAKKGESDLAEETLNRVLSNDPSHLGAITALVRLYIEKKDIGQIERLLGRLERKHQERGKSSSDGIVDTTLIGIN
ncbi:MAG: tetratricopeptide repeat protein [bacterium]